MGKIDLIRSFYEEKMGKGLPDHEVLGWESNEAQKRRFEVFAGHVKLDGKKILDVGCGLGNMLEYLDSKGIDVDYTGVDISEKMVSSAKSRKLDGKFYCMDVFKSHPFKNEEFDVIYASGIFNINLGNNREFLLDALNKLLHISRHIIVFNLLHHNSPDREDKYYYFSPEDVEKIVESMPHRIKKVEIIQDYLDNDFTVIVEKVQSK